MLRRYAFLTAVATFILLLAGGLVTSTGSGLSVPDWPLSYGTLFPPMVGGIRFEHTHRLIAGAVGLMILILAVWLWRIEPRRWVRRLGYAALAAVFLQALLGGLTVLLLLPAPISIAHACLGPTIFCFIVCIASATAHQWADEPVRIEISGRPSLRVCGLLCAGLAAFQLLLGAVIRHGAASPVAPHVAGAISLAGMVGWTTVRLARARRAAPTAWQYVIRLALLVGAQLALGVMVLGHRGSVLVRTAHVGIGSLILAQAVILAWELARATSAQQTGSPRTASSFQDYLELTKPRLSALVLVTTGVGWWLGLREPSQIRWLMPVLLGTALTAGGANTLNEWSERRLDALMDRTKHRPLPAGRLRPEAAFRFGGALSLLGIGFLFLFVNPLSALLALLTWAAYLFLYTPLKRVTSLCTLVGAIPGALPPLIGWAGARGSLGGDAWALFGLLYVWQLPHFLALAVLYRDDYAKAGFRMLPLIEGTGAMAARQIALYGLVLVPVSLFPAIVRIASPAYFYGAMTLSLAFLAIAVRAAWQRSSESCRQLFLASVLYLPMLLSLLAINRTAL